VSRVQRAGRLLWEFASSNVAYDRESETKAYLEIEKIRRRYLFQLLHVLSFTDYEVGVGMGMENVNKYVGGRENFRLSEAGTYKVHLKRPGSRRQFVFLSDQKDVLSTSTGWRKQLYVDHDCFGEGAAGFSVPFGIHPAQVLAGRHEKLDRYRAQDPKVTVLFAGACQPEEYATDEITELFGKVPRNALYESLCRVLDDGTYTTTRDPERLLNADEKLDAALFVLAADGTDNRVAQADWFRVLAAADFFVAGPGVYMPMSHNAVESLAVGTIPIIEYPELFTPNLSAAEACVPFRGREEFKERVRSCLAMEASARSALKREALAYYDTHLSPRAVGRNLQREVLDGSPDTTGETERINIIGGHESVEALKKNENKYLKRHQ